MSIAIHTNNGRVAHDSLKDLSPASLRAGARLAERLELARVFSDTVLRYLLLVLPLVSRELSHWRAKAAEIPSPSLRRSAAEALAKRGNIEGAALFATLAPASQRRSTVRALVAFQTAYNYLDALSELPSEDPISNGEQLHQALLSALHPGAPRPDYYAYNADGNDGGYLDALVDACREAFARLPSHAAAAPRAHGAAARIVQFQALNLSEAQGGHRTLRRWAKDVSRPGSGLAWWETAAASGSSLAVHALIATAAHADLDASHARQIESAYFPSLGALHSLLDSLVDRAEDRKNGQRSLLDYYGSPRDAATRLAALARTARGAVQQLPNPHAHRVILTAMCSYYLSAHECDTTEGRTITDALTDALGMPLNLAILMFRSRRLFHALIGDGYT